VIYNNIRNVEEKEIKTFLVNGKMEPVKGTTVKWLSKAGDPSMPDYGLRFFRIKPGGFIPEHQHTYAQTQIIQSGKILATGYENGKRIEKELVQGDFCYVPPMEMHGMKNLGDEDVTFFCCICVLGE
jgi:quercetin dioxygenase-like cupin family protein